MDEWIAFRRIRHDPMDRIAWILREGFLTLIAAQGVQPDEEMIKRIDPQMALDPSDDNEVSPEQGVKIISSVLGRPHGNANR